MNEIECPNCQSKDTGKISLYVDTSCNCCDDYYDNERNHDDFVMRKDTGFFKFKSISLYACDNCDFVFKVQ